jgi:hypothetical protein
MKRKDLYMTALERQGSVEIMEMEILAPMRYPCHLLFKSFLFLIGTFLKLDIDMLPPFPPSLVGYVWNRVRKDHRDMENR